MEACGNDFARRRGDIARKIKRTGWRASPDSTCLNDSMIPTSSAVAMRAKRLAVRIASSLRLFLRVFWKNDMNVRSLAGIALGALLALPLPAGSAPLSAFPTSPSFRFPSQNLYVSNRSTNAITIYSASANGNIAPQRTIAGPKTQLVAPGSLAVDLIGHLYVANGTNILEFGPLARGDVRPTRVLSVPFPGAAFTVVTALTVGDDGTLYAGVVTAPVMGGLTGYLLRYAPHGTVATTYVEGGIGANSLTLDSTETRVLSAVNAFRSCAASGVEAIPKNFTASSQSANIISNPNLCLIRSIIEDRKSQSYLLTSTNANGFFRFAETVTSPQQSSAPLAQVTSAQAGGWLALDAQRNIFDATALGNSIAVFAPAANGAVTPIRVIAGPATQLNSIAGIAIGGLDIFGRFSQ